MPYMISEELSLNICNHHQKKLNRPCVEIKWLRERDALILQFYYYKPPIPAVNGYPVS